MSDLQNDNSEPKWMKRTMQDRIESAQTRREELQRVCRIEGTAILIRYPDIEEDYEVALSRCDTHEKIIYWVLHLSMKRSATPAILGHFVFLACDHHGISPSIHP